MYTKIEKLIKYVMTLWKASMFVSQTAKTIVTDIYQLSFIKYVFHSWISFSFFCTTDGNIIIEENIDVYLDIIYQDTTHILS